jgi:ABC-type oligopeptide transport system ATPase subunit
MKSGKIVERGPTKQILCDPKNEYTLSLINAAPKFPDFLHA